MTNTFDPAGDLSALKVASGSVTLASTAYTRDGAGQPLTMAPTGLPGGAQTYTYTTREQLKSSTTGATTAAYGYDAAAHPTTTAGSNQAFDAAGQICWALPGGTSTAGCSAAPTGATSYQYDVQGNRTSMTPSGAAATTYGYDQADRLTSVSGPGGGATYAYDGSGLRTAKKSESVTNSFTWDAGEVPDLLSGGGTQWFFHDGQGSTRALLGANGAIAGTYAYDPYGRVIAASTGVKTPIQAYKRAQQKIKQAEKYQGDRNAKKRSNNNNFVNDVVTGLVVVAAFVSGVGRRSPRSLRALRRCSPGESGVTTGMTDEADEWYAVRCVFRWTDADDRPYEERITLWRATDLDTAIARAESEAREYAENTGVTYLGLAQGYETGEKDLTEGCEVFSLLRESALSPEEYLDRHFDTGGEHERTT
ncbi:hypothetical protein [Amycolatopsis sp. PS_44_ISF1]|uniref:hypothetical protein n=1 Tax=Amycolatopsis sp. PS_44_ISF1 TaxID=2974917 RepID=UPI0028DE7A46|nr:hypothetical protein [Amycolatopsis sp. PS_44_ISF1]MDT8914276.1 hypothetical protein [Amycolatopsis sp. PS_44_ISF1]